MSDHSDRGGVDKKVIFSAMASNQPADKQRQNGRAANRGSYKIVASRTGVLDNAKAFVC